MNFHFSTRDMYMYKKRFALFVCIIVWFIGLSGAEEVCKFTYKGQPEELHGENVVIHEKAVAWSEYIYVGTPKGATPVEVITPSIMFVIDNSGSMEQADKDKWGNRFNVTRDLIDSLRMRFPKTEVGVTVWGKYLYFDPQDDQIRFRQCPEQDSGAYIPLYVLDSSYAPDGKMGYEIIKQYLATDTVTVGGTVRHVELEYKPTTNELAGRNTHINAGFDAAKDAMDSSLYEVDCHFIVFLSDGVANTAVNGRDPDEYVLATEVPPTYTVYFTRNGQLPQTIADFTTNVQNNGYSKNSPGSKAWAFENTHYDSLMQLLMDSIVNVISQLQTSYPTGIVVNNNINPNGPWDSTGFTFDKLFPLTGWTTPFVYDIDYKIIVDSILENGDTIQVQKDTSTHVEFTVEIQDGAPEPPDTFLVEYWERNLDFYHNGTLITLADETMQELEIRFTFDPGEAKYSYKEASVEMTHEKGDDKENFKLTKNNDYFTHTFKREINTSPSSGDGTLQHFQDDNIIATFRNPELILDTLVKILPFKLSGDIEIKNVYYYDRDAEGYVDSILLEIEGTITEDHVDPIVKQIKLPEFRKFTIDDKKFDNGNIVLFVTEDKKDHNPQTYVSDKDVVEVTGTVLSVGGLLLGGTVKCTDKVAPIIHWEDKSAFLKDYRKKQSIDSLWVRFSEPIMRIKKSEPFKYMDVSASNKVYKTRLTDLEITSKNDTMIFRVDEILDGVEIMQEGDSIWIRRMQEVSDVAGNTQDNDLNIKRKLWVKILSSPFQITPWVITPFDPINPNGIVIPPPIVEIINNNQTHPNIIDLINSGNLINGKPNGITPIQLKPNGDLNNLDPNFKLAGKLYIYDAVANTVIGPKKMIYDHKTKSLWYFWNCKNSLGRTVGRGTYLVNMFFTDINPIIYPNGGPTKNKRTFVSIMKAKKN